MAKGNTWMKQKLARARIVGSEPAAREMRISDNIGSGKARAFTTLAPAKVRYVAEPRERRMTALEAARVTGPDRLIRNGQVIG